MLTIFDYGTDRRIVTAPMAGSWCRPIPGHRSGMPSRETGTEPGTRKWVGIERAWRLSIQSIGQGLDDEFVGEILGRSPVIH